MRIAQVAPLAESVPPKLYGGTERVVSWLTEELVALGHEVTLFASADSRTKATLVSVCRQGLRLGRPRVDAMAANALQLEAVARRASEFDVIHCHSDWIHLPLLSRLGVPFLTTLHGRLDLPGITNVIDQFPDASFVSISENQRRPLTKAHWLATIYHGLPPTSFRPCFSKGSYLAFLGRLTADKGPEIAISIAQATGIPLRIAAKIPSADRAYFKEKIEPFVDGDFIKLVGEVNDREKQQFLAGARALLFSIRWPEPFGLVMIEAMACGTPVIAFRSGSVPEVIEDGVTGFIVDTKEQAVQRVACVDQLDRRRVRACMEERFSSRRMAENYLSVYREMVQSANCNHLSGALSSAADASIL